MRKKAFTMAEVMIVFILIGIISTIEVVTIVRPWELAYKYAYNKLYNALTATIYNYMTTMPISTETSTAFPAKSEDFCKALVTYLNTANHQTATSNSCKKEKNIFGNNPNQNDFTDAKVQMILSNGVKIWIGSNNKNINKNIEYFTYKESGKDELAVNYYIVYADINGDRKPNIIQKNGNKIPDIVAFAVTDKFSVVPLGLPTVERRYLTAYVLYPSLTDDEDGDEINEIPSDPMTYFEAKVQTYGTYDTSGNTYSKRLISEDIVHSYDFEHNVFANNNAFRIGKPENYFKTIPKFDSAKCGNGYELGNVALAESACEVRIYDYN